MSRFDVAPGLRHKVQSEKVSTGRDDVFRMFGFAQGADLDRAVEDHATLPMSVAIAFVRSGASMIDSPTSTALTPQAASRTTSARLAIPLSETKIAACGRYWANASVVPRSTTNVLRSRLLTPITVAPSAPARSISARLWTSTRTPR